MDNAARISLDCTGPVTVAVLRHRDGQIEPLRFDGAPQLPTGVFLADGGRLLTGRAALDASTAARDRYVAAPLRLLTTEPDPASADPDALGIVAALLGRVREQASNAAAASITEAVIVVPPGWGPQRRTRLRHAAHRAGLTHIEMVDSATALAHHHFSAHQPAATGVGDQAVVLVCRLLGADYESTVLRRTDGGFEELATISGTGLSDLDGEAAVARAVALTADALTAAELTGTDITSVALHAPAGYLSALAAGLRELGITTTTRTVADTDTVHGALSIVIPSITTTPRRWRQARHAVASAVPLPGAIGLLWLLLQTGVSPVNVGDTLSRYPPPAYMYTLWPAWSMIAVLVFLGVLAIAVLRADRRLGHSTQDTETDRRRYLARGLQVAAGGAVAAGLITTMLGTVSYQVVPVWYFLLWATGPALILAGIAVLISLLVEHGYTSALRWQIWLRFPNTTTVLMIAGLIAIQVYLYTTASRSSLRFYPGLPDGVDQLGTIALGLAVLPLVVRYLERQVIASPLVIGVVIWTHSYTNMTVVIGILLAAIIGWWLLRIRPAAAYADPDHPASILAAELEPQPNRV